MIVWLVGLSGAGKTTIARELHRQWQAREPATVLIDGDEIREIFKQDQNAAAYTPEGRRINAERIAATKALLDGLDTAPFGDGAAASEASRLARRARG